MLRKHEHLPMIFKEFTSKKQQQTILISLLIDYRKINEKDMAQSQSKLHCTEQLGAIKCI